MWYTAIKLWEPGDSVIADRASAIAGLLKRLKISLDVLAFLRSSDQILNAEVTESQNNQSCSNTSGKGYSKSQEISAD